MRDLSRILPLVVVLLSPAIGLCGDLEKGLEAYNIGDYETSLSECQPLADEGIADAQFCVGRLYANGFGVVMDDAQALHWYGLAAEQGQNEARYSLGVMHANGWGVDMNDEVAATWFRKAAETGFILAVTSFADLCQRGMGVEQDNVEAYAWYSVAAQLGDINAEFDRDAAAEELSPEELQSAQKMAEEFLAAIDVESMRVDQAY